MTSYKPGEGWTAGLSQKSSPEWELLQKHKARAHAGNHVGPGVSPVWAVVTGVKPQASEADHGQRWAHLHSCQAQWGPAGTLWENSSSILNRNSQPQGHPFITSLVKYMHVLRAVFTVVWVGLMLWRQARWWGKTSPADSKPGTILGDTSIQAGGNIFHSSNSVESAKEMSLWFQPEEINGDYKSCARNWMSERQEGRPPCLS